jgi:positive regulator of sigma E activity
MTQEAKVIKIDNEKTYVLVKRTSACSGNCKSCSGCEGKKIIAQAKNEIGAKVGDDVVIFSDTKKTLYLAFKLYILPLIMLFTVLFLNEAYAFSPYILTFLILLVVAVWIFVLKTSKVMLHQIVEVSNK